LKDYAAKLKDYARKLKDYAAAGVTQTADTIGLLTFFALKLEQKLAGCRKKPHAACQDGTERMAASITILAFSGEIQCQVGGCISMGNGVAIPGLRFET